MDRRRGRGRICSDPATAWARLVSSMRVWANVRTIAGGKLDSGCNGLAATERAYEDEVGGAKSLGAAMVST